MKTDPFIEHLKRYDLLVLHEEAEKVGYRVRTATDWTFTMEYQGGLPEFSCNPYWLQDFENTPEGKQEAEAFLAFVAAFIVFKQRHPKVVHTRACIDILMGKEQGGCPAHVCCCGETE